MIGAIVIPVNSSALRAIGFWSGPHSSDGWPDVDDFVDPEWDENEREFIANYLTHGLLGRTYMGWSTCRVCGKADNGDSEHSDGVFVWPSGLAHYVSEHSVRLPQEFVRHAFSLTEHLEGDRDEDWWRVATLD